MISYDDGTVRFGEFFWCLKVSHISKISNYSGSQTFNKIGDIQFSIKNNIEKHVAAVHEEVKPFEN